MPSLMHITKTYLLAVCWSSFPCRAMTAEKAIGMLSLQKRHCHDKIHVKTGNLACPDWVPSKQSHLGRVHVETSWVKPRFQNLGFEMEKIFNQLDNTMETCINLNNYFW